VLTAIIIVVMLIIAVGLVALYREVGLGQWAGAERTEAPRPVNPTGWPLGSLAVGSHVVVPTEEPFTGFLALCSDDQDALGELHSAAVVAEDWGYPMLVAVTKTAQPDGWVDGLDSLPGNIGHYAMRADQLRALKPSRLPVVVFLNESRLLEASVALDSPSSISNGFQHCRFGLTR
jgi:hypothetical protein